MKSGSIEFNGRTIACRIRNQSDTGAALEVVSSLGIPAQITLLIVADRLRCGCTVIWRMRHTIGVKFLPARNDSADGGLAHDVAGRHTPGLTTTVTHQNGYSRCG
ncbi:PilZ domain-containing protein [Bradyrhizobium sp. 170]|uniref:PilZ domain-containing protein n=1 Tax=Bradyrhizobium sp. 170 TaxID=2782641 RepID=UPI003211F4D1